MSSQVAGISTLDMVLEWSLIQYTIRKQKKWQIKLIISVGTVNPSHLYFFTIAFANERYCMQVPAMICNDLRCLHSTSFNQKKNHPFDIS